MTRRGSQYEKKRMSGLTSQIAAWAQSAKMNLLGSNFDKSETKDAIESLNSLILELKRRTRA